MAAYKDVSPKIGIPSGLILSGDVLYHFDKFKGVITSLDKSGNIIAVFDAYDDYRNRGIKDLLEESKNDPAKLIFTNWAHVCMDDSGKIYTLPRRTKEGKYQELLVFSKEGDYLYSKPLDFFKTTPVDQFSIYKNNFVFLTKDLDIFIAK